GRGTVRVGATFDEATGAFGPSNGAHVWGMLGTLAVDELLPDAAVATLLAAQEAGGGWEWQPGFGPDSNTTSLAVQALVAAGEPVSATAVVSGLAYLKSTQQSNGGFAYDAVSGTGSDANSTAYVLQALAAAGETPTSAAWTVEGATAVDFLLSLQLEDGAFEWQAGSGANAFATQQVVAALLRQPYPIAVRPLERCRAP
ncbi:MAG: prenyltransferase/squalene oxidase repeat-containing protein, partial [Caldilineaceae bacterium]